jgi:hypothetical protein
MSRPNPFVLFVAFATLVHIVCAAEELPKMQTVHGTIEKIEKESLTISYKSGDSKIDKKLTFKLTGTSRFSILSTQKRGDKIVLVQRDAEVKNLAEKQGIAVIYATSAGEHVLLTAVAQSE